MQLSLSEIVSSVQGEGKFTGYPTTFVRLYGCNLNCEWCDTRYALKGKHKNMSVESILGYIFKMGNQHVCITGGEPLIQESVYCLVYDLVDRKYIVSIETNGAVEIDDDTYERSFNYCMDIKCPSSGMSHKNLYSNLGNLHHNDEVKFVIKDYTDFRFAYDVIHDYPTRASIILSPCFNNGGHNGKELSQWLLEDKIKNARVGLQMHRLLNVY